MSGKPTTREQGPERGNDLNLRPTQRYVGGSFFDS